MNSTTTEIIFPFFKLSSCFDDVSFPHLVILFPAEEVGEEVGEERPTGNLTRTLDPPCLPSLVFSSGSTSEDILQYLAPSLYFLR